VTYQRETEATLGVAAADPEAVLARIAVLDRVGGYQLLPRPPRNLRDVYLDSPGRALAARGAALRVREADGARLLTVKGPAAPGAGGARVRFEFEAPWSKDALGRALDALRGMGVCLSRLDTGPLPTDPLDALARLDLCVVQERHTRRTPRDVFTDGEGAGEPLAELASDEVTYPLGGLDVRHAELEVEVKAAEGTAAMTKIIAALLAAFGPVLRRWDHGSRLATGEALRFLQAAGRLEGPLGARACLTPEAYDLLAANLGRSQHGRPTGGD
jgi:inorganic triphosphatase YgiF